MLTTDCPTCRDPFVEEIRRTTGPELRGPLAKKTHVLRCEHGHEFDVSHTFQDGDRTWYSVAERERVPPVSGLAYAVVPTSDPCVGCSGDVQPGQAYVRTGDGPRHLGC